MLNCGKKFKPRATSTGKTEEKLKLSNYNIQTQICHKIKIHLNKIFSYQRDKDRDSHLRLGI